MKHVRWTVKDGWEWELLFWIISAILFAALTGPFTIWRLLGFMAAIFFATIEAS